jgi:threonine/homoserine/homoserine lactone efflux protein
LLVSLYIRDALVWGLWGVVALFIIHWFTDVGWLTGLSWLTGTGRSIISPQVYRWIMIVCGLALIIFGASFIFAGLNFLVSGELGLG